MTTQAVTFGGALVTTDSGAAATAMATGQKVVETVISQSIPGDFSDLETSLEYWQARGKRAGLVTTSYIEDATPAAFAAHVVSRIFTDEITDDYLSQTYLENTEAFLAEAPEPEWDGVTIMKTK